MRMGKYNPQWDVSLMTPSFGWPRIFSPLSARTWTREFRLDGWRSARCEQVTEAKAARFGEEMLADLDKDTVDFVPDYDSR